MTEQPAAKPNADDVAEIDAFCDAVWLEDGLSRASLASYRSDLGRFARWLAGQNQNLLQADEAAVAAYIAGLSQQMRAASQARHLSSLRRFYRRLLVERRLSADPTRRIANPVRPARLPKLMVNRRSRPCSRRRRPKRHWASATAPCWKRFTQRGCAYRSWLASSCTNSISTWAGPHLRQGQQGRLVPLGEEAIAWLRRYLAEARPALLDQRPHDALFVTSAPRV